MIGHGLIVQLDSYIDDDFRFRLKEPALKRSRRRWLKQCSQKSRCHPQTDGAKRTNHKQCADYDQSIAHRSTPFTQQAKSSLPKSMNAYAYAWDKDPACYTAPVMWFLIVFCGTVLAIGGILGWLAAEAILAMDRAFGGK